jgi:hypothetical protein
MHSDGHGQRHERRLMRRLTAALAAAAAVAAVGAGAVPAGARLLAEASPATAGSVTVMPASAVLYTFSQFTVSGTALAADGGGFVGDVNVTFDDFFAGDAHTNDDGSFRMTFSVPTTDGGASAAQCGANTVTVTEMGDDEFEDFQVGQATIDLGCAAISVSPSLVGNQQLPATFAVTPQNFPEPTGFTLTVDGTPQAFTPGPGGTLDFTGSPSCGAHQVTLSQTFDEQVISASAQITVLCPQITLTPSSIPLASQPATVTVTGTQFHANQPVSISLNGAVVGSTVTGEDGNFSVPITARGLDCAAHQVTAAEQPAAGGPAFLFSASALLLVTGCTRSLSVDPAVLEPGQVTRVTGTGFAPGVPVVLTWQLPGGTPLLGTLTVTPGGGGNISGFFLVMPGDVLGQRQVVATQPGDKLTAGALVQAGPMEPSPGGQLVDRE